MFCSVQFFSTSQFSLRLQYSANWQYVSFFSLVALRCSYAISFSAFLRKTTGDTGFWHHILLTAKFLVLLPWFFPHMLCALCIVETQCVALHENSKYSTSLGQMNSEFTVSFLILMCQGCRARTEQHHCLENMLQPVRDSVWYCSTSPAEQLLTAYLMTWCA